MGIGEGVYLICFYGHPNSLQPSDPSWLVLVLRLQIFSHISLVYRQEHEIDRVDSLQTTFIPP